MYVCAIGNQKGGVGKTTTAHNLGVQLAREKNKRVLLFDLDAQGNLSDACGLEPLSLEKTAFDVLSGTVPLLEVRKTLEDRLDIIPANIRLAEADLTFSGRIGRENLLKKVLAPLTDEYDYVLLDCPPSLGLLTVNALNAANALLVPVQVEYHALAGLTLIGQTVELVRDLNPELKILGLVLTFFDSRKTLNRDVAAELSNKWGDLLFSTRIRDNVSLAEAPSNGEDVFSYKKSSYGAKDYAALATEFLHRTEG
jgi:ATPase, parA family